VARRVAALGAAALPRRQSIPPCSSTVASSIQQVLWFCKIRPNFELTTKFHQNESCVQATKLLLVSKAKSEWKIMNLTKQFEFQIPNWGNSNF